MPANCVVLPTFLYETIRIITTSSTKGSFCLLALGLDEILDAFALFSESPQNRFFLAIAICLQVVDALIGSMEKIVEILCIRAQIGIF